MEIRLSKIRLYETLMMPERKVGHCGSTELDLFMSRATSNKRRKQVRISVNEMNTSQSQNM